jgi:ABC-2 type transport system ATP-binding protein
MAMNPSASPVDVRHLAKSFGTRPALTDVSLTLAPGTVTGLLGRNGAGKTTLIKCLLGLLRPTAGSCSLLGEDSTDLSPAAKARVGYVPQEPLIYPWMRVRQGIAYQGAFYERWDNVLVEELLKTFALEPRQRIGALSVGQLQKLAILLALASRPDVLLLDEPVAALDPEGRRDFLRLLVDLVADGTRTVLLSTHITTDVERVCSHVAILKEGKLLQMTDLDELRASVKELRLTSTRPLPAVLHGGPGILRYQATGSSAVLTVQGEVPAIVARLQRELAAEVTVVDLSLEDVFLELHRGAEESP